MKASAKDLRYKTKEIVGEGKQEEALFGIWKDNMRVEDVHAFLDHLRGGRFGDR